jgi:hypothetical protein
MLQFLRRIGRSGRKAQVRSAAPSVRPTVEWLEGRDLPAVIPLPPTGVVATSISSSAITLSWNASSDPTVTGYDVYSRVWIGYPHGGGKYVYTQLGSNLTTASDTLTGLTSGSHYTYVVTAVNSTGQSLYSYPATAVPWVAPTLLYGGTYYQLSSGAQATGTDIVTAGLITEVSIYVSGTPLTWSLHGAPSTASINHTTGVLTYTPAASEVGTVNITIQAANALGAVSQTIQFNVVAANPNLATPTLVVSGTTGTYNGQYQLASAVAYGTDGVTPVSGTYQFAYNGSASNYPPYGAGTTPVLVTFTSSDSNYGNATVLTKVVISQAKPVYSYLSAPKIAAGQSPTTLLGYLGVGTLYPTGDYVIITVNGVGIAAPVASNGSFSASFDTSGLSVGNYTISYAFTGDANFKAVTGTRTLKVVPTAPPQVTRNPQSQTITAGDWVTFTAAATGSPPPTVQWQYSTDGGQTWTNITGATTDQLGFYVNSGENHYDYRAVFTNSVGTATSLFATLTVESDGGGGGG